MEIESYFPGRLRVSSKLFTSQRNIDRIREWTGGIDGVRGITANLRIGSLTITYDAARISREMLEDAGRELRRMEAEMED